MSEAYDLRSNIKGKPGSQGTLFQVRDKGLLNPQQRWPKGYTPERQAEVRDALKDTTIIGPGHFGRATPEQMDKGRFYAYPEAEHRINTTIARSTIPSEHLKGIDRIHDEPAEGTVGTYWPGKREIGLGQVTRAMLEPGARPRKEPRETQADVDKTLIHEIGHHVDTAYTRETDKISQSLAAQRVGSSPHGPDVQQEAQRIDRGVGEAVADNYAMEHYRGPGRNPERLERGVYTEHHSPAKLERDYPGYNQAAHGSYMNKRPARSPLGPQFQSERLF